MMPRFDLASLDTVAACSKGAEIELRHPSSGAPLGIFWRVVGRDAPQFEAAKRAALNRQIAREAERKVGDPVPNDDELSEMAKQEAAHLLAACSLGWRTGDDPTIEFDGAALSFNEANARTVLARLPWVRRQVDAGVGNLANFLPA